jgi:hypothetical protein
MRVLIRVAAEDVLSYMCEKFLFKTSAISELYSEVKHYIWQNFLLHYQ